MKIMVCRCIVAKHKTVYVNGYKTGFTLNLFFIYQRFKFFLMLKKSHQDA